MANTGHLERLRQGVRGWNDWRKNLEVTPNLSGAALSGAALSGVDLSGVDLSDTNLRGANLSGVDLSDTNLRGTNLSGANLFGADLSDTNLSDTNLSGAALREVNLSDTNLRGADLSGADLSDTNLRKANLSGANLRSTELSGFNLSGTDLSGVDLSDTNLFVANLSEANLSEANLSEANLSGANLSGTDLRGANLRGTALREANLSGFHLSGANLSGANLSGANLRGTALREANLSGANLYGSNLCRVTVLRTNFEKAVFTGACLEDWNINSATNFEGAICDHIYLKYDLDNGPQERRPREGSFQPGEFAALFQQAVDTVDLIFKDGIDWQAFFQSFQDLRSQYADQDLSIQAIEKKQGGAFVVRVEVDEGADKAAIESSAKELYETQLKALEAQYEKQLRLQGAHLEDIQAILKVERDERTRLTKVVEKMAEGQEPPKYDLRGAQFAGGFAETVQGDQIGGTINNAAAETPSLTEAAAEIQALLKQLEQTALAETTTQKMTLATQAIAQIESNPTFKQRTVAALTAGGFKAFEAAIDHPVAAFVVGAIEEWKQS